MHVRKVQKVSTETFVVSLPKDWAKRHHVRAGSMLSIAENPSGSLVISPGPAAASEKPPRLSGELLEESIVACYILGAQTIIVENAVPQVRARVLTILQGLPGLEVDEEGRSSLTIRCHLDEASLRIFLMLDRMCVLLTYGLELALAGSAQALAQNEHEINRTYHLCQRILTRASYDVLSLERSGIPSSRVIPSLHLLVKRLEHAGDAIKDLPSSLPPKGRTAAARLVGIICGMIRILTARKLESSSLDASAQIESCRKGQTHPQILFLARTAHDVLEELILLRMAALLIPGRQ